MEQHDWRKQFLEPAWLMRYPHWPHILLAGGCALILSLLVSSYMQAALGLSAQKSLEWLTVRTDRLDQLMMQMIDAETSVRSYQLTGAPIYLDNYRAAVPKVPEIAKAIRHDYAGESDELIAAEQVIQLANQKLEVLNQHIINRARMHRMDVKEMAHGKVLMDELRQRTRSLKASLTVKSQASIRQSVAGFELTRVATILLALGALVLLVLLFALSQRQQQLREQIARILGEENEKLEREVKQRTDDLVQLATYLTNVREAEKFRLARELHDELGALLTAAKLDAGWIERKLPEAVLPGVTERLTRLQKALGAGIALKRRITNDLRPALLSELGLVASLRVMGEEFARTDEVVVELALPEEDVVFPENLSLALFRIVQEALTNTRKYAKAHQVNITLRQEAERIRLSVADDGVGFDIESPTLARHGLAGMKHRVQMLAGSIQVVSRPGAGTRIEVEAPLVG